MLQIKKEIANTRECKVDNNECEEPEHIALSREVRACPVLTLVYTKTIIS